MSKNYRLFLIWILSISLISGPFPWGTANASGAGAEDELMAWYKLDAPFEHNGKLVAEDSSGNQFHSIDAIGTWSPDGGMYGGAMSFNGVSDLIQLNVGSTPAGSFLKDAFTEHAVSLWFKANDTQALQVLFERGGNASGLAIQLNANKLEAAVASGGEREIVSVEFTDTSTWHHVMATFDNGLFTLYLDGQVADASTAPFANVNTALNEAAIGAKYSVYAFGGDNLTGAWFNGMIDDVRLYNQAVSPAFEVAGVSLDKTRLTTTVGEAVQLDASIQPSIATNRNVIWSSSDESVVTVTPASATQAVVEAQKAGSATITVTTEDGGYTASSEITILSELISMPYEDLIAWYTLDAPFEYNGKEVAEDASGNGHHSVTAIGNWLQDGGIAGGAFAFDGTTSIMQLNTNQMDFLREGFSEFTAAMWFKPNDLNTRQVLFERGGPAAGLAIQLNNGYLEAAVVSGGLGNRSVLSTALTETDIWHHVAVSFENGHFKLFLNGSLADDALTSFNEVGFAANEGAVGARFAVDAFDGSNHGGHFNGVIDDVRLYSAAVDPVVGTVHAESVIVDLPAITLGTGLAQELLATVFPRHATNQKLIWTSSDEAVAEVTTDGGLKAVVHGRAEGTATITAITVDGGYEATSTVIVENIPVTSISLGAEKLKLMVETAHTLTPAFTPANASNKHVSWSSDNPSIATVDETGVVSALRPGSATITVTTMDGGHTDSMVIEVNGIPVETIALNHTNLSLAVDQEHLLSAAIMPGRASNHNVIWTSSDSSVATVDALGRVTAVKPGAAVITATTEDGGLTASSEVTVNTYAIKKIDNLFRVDSGSDIGKKATLYDGTIEKYNGYYYAMGTGTLGSVYRSKDMIHWESPYMLISNDPKNASVGANPDDYRELGASDLFFHNGVMFYAFNGTTLLHGDPSKMNTEPNFINSFPDKKYDSGIDPQLFVAHNGDLVFLRKVNPDEVNPDTGAAKPGRASAWLWKVDSFFNELGHPGRGTGIETITTQKGHWGNMNFVNFEGPELYYHNGQYYMLYLGNQMFPETGLYDTGVAQTGHYDEFTNDSKYPGKLLDRNIEDLILKYRVILPTAEHGSQPYHYTFEEPQAGWSNAGSDAFGWESGEGGFGWPEERRAKIPTIYNAGKSAASDIWAHPNGQKSMWAKRSFELDAVPETTALRYRLEGYGKLYVNGVEFFSFGGQQRAFKNVEVPADLLQAGENVIAVEISTEGGSPLNFYHLDFGLYDTNGHPVEPDIIGPAQPNVLKGPNGFETWVVYKAFWNSDNGQGKDRIYFWDQEMVVDGPTSFDSDGLHPDAWSPTFHDRFDSASSLQHYVMPETAGVSIDDGTLYFNAPADMKQVLLKGYEAENFFMEANLRFDDDDFGDTGQAGIVVWHQDEHNYVSLMIDRYDRKLVVVSAIDGVSEISATDLPSTFAFLHDDPRAADFAEQYHTLKVYKNGSKLFAELDHYKLNDDRPVFEHEAMAESGQIGLLSNKANVRMDNVTVTTGWSEYGQYINGWDEEWQVSEKGLLSPSAGEAHTFKGDQMLEHEFSVNIHTGVLPESGRAGITLAYIDDQNYVTASTNYATKQFELRKVVGGREEIIDVASTARDTIYGHSNYEQDGQREYVYDLRAEAEISSAQMLWFHGPFDYTNKNFVLPDSNSAAFKFDTWTGDWEAVPFTYEDKGKGDYHIADFEERITTSQLRLSVPSESNRPFTFVLREEISAQHFYKAVRSKGKLYVWVNNELIFDVEDPFADKAAQIGLYTEDLQAAYNAFTGFDVSGSIFDLDTETPGGGNPPGGNPGSGDSSGGNSGGGPTGETSDDEETDPTSENKERQADVSPNESVQLEIEGKVKLEIPAGAVSSKGTVRIAIVESDEIPAIGDLQPVSETFELISTVGDRFSKPLELSIVYNAKQLQPGDEPAVYYYNEDQQRWIFIGGTAEDGTIRVNVRHAAKFAVFSYEPAALSDMENHWSSSYVHRLTGMNVLAGYPDGSFRPDISTTRYEFAKMLISALSMAADTSDTNFSDDAIIPTWAKPSIAAAVKAGLIQGYEEGGTTSFKGELAVTRAEAAIMIVNALKLYGVDFVGSTDNAPSLKDESDIPSWAKPSIDQALSAGILNGYQDGTFRAGQQTTRAEAATMIYNLLLELGI